MSFFTFFDKLSPANWSTIAYIKKEFPEPIERLDTATGTTSTVSVYEAVREIQFSLGKSFDDGWALYATELRGDGSCTRDGRFVFTRAR